MKKNFFDETSKKMITELVELRLGIQHSSVEDLPGKLEEFNKLRADFSAMVDKFHSQKSCSTFLTTSK